MSSEFRRDEYDPSDEGEYTRGLVCVAMPFGKEWNEAHSVIKQECTKLGLRAERVDEYVKSGVVIRDIADLIENAQFLIFDLSGERQNVYYELGYAHGVGNEAIEILLVAKEGTKLHYDIAGLRVHLYDSLDHLREILSTALPTMIEACRRRGETE